MTKVVANDKESIDRLIRRFNKEVQRAGILTEFRKREFYEKPSVKKKRKLSQKAKKVYKASFD